MRLQRSPLTALVVSMALPFAPALCAPAQTSAAADSQASEPQTAPITAANTIAVTDRYLTAVQAEVASKLDTRSAAPGQQVTLRILAPAILADGTELPRDSKLVGHVMRAQAFEKDHSGAMLAITFDHAELKNGKTVPVRCVIRIVAPPAGVAANSSARNAPAGGGSPMGVSGIPIGGDASSSSGSLGGALGNGSPMGAGAPSGGGVTTTSTRGGGGGLGGIGAGDPGVGGAAGGPMHPIGETVGSVLGDTSALNQPTDRPVASAGEHVADVPHRTALPGVLLSNSSSAGVSGTLTAFDKNISLDAGTRVVLGVITR